MRVITIASAKARAVPLPRDCPILNSPCAAKAGLHVYRLEGRWGERIGIHSRSPGSMDSVPSSVQIRCSINVYETNRHLSALVPSPFSMLLVLAHSPCRLPLCWGLFSHPPSYDMGSASSTPQAPALAPGLRP